MADELTLAFSAIRDLGARNSALQSALRDLQEKYDAIQKNDEHEEIEVHKASILRLTTTLQQEKERHNSELQKKNDLIAQYVEDFRTETTQLGKCIISKDQSIVDLRNEVKDLRMGISRRDASLLKKKERLIALRGKFKTISELTASLRDEADSHLEIAQREKETNATLRGEAAIHLEFIQKEKEFRAVLQKKVDDITESNSTLQKKVDDTSELNATLRREIGEVSELNSSLQKKVDEVSETNLALQKKVNEMTRRMEKKDEHIQFLTTVNTELNEGIEELKTQSNASESSALKKKDEHIQFLVDANKELNEDIAELQRQIDTNAFAIELDQLKEALKAVTNAKTLAEYGLSVETAIRRAALEREDSNMLSFSKGFEEKNEEIAKLQQRIIELTDELGTREVIKLIDNKMTSLEQHMTSIESNVAFGCVVPDTTNCISFNCNANSDLKFENDRLTSLLKKTEDSLTSSRMNCEEIEMKNLRLADANDEYKSKLANANMQTKRLEAEVLSLKKKTLEREKELEEKQRRLVTSLRDIATSSTDHSYFHTSSSSCSHHLQ
jgi:chromosome segregation ATPase